MWKAAKRWIRDHSCPLPDASRLEPHIVSMWNKLKAGVDVTTRYIETLGSPLHQATMEIALWDRLFVISLVNAFHAFRWVMVEDKIDRLQRKDLHHLKKLANHTPLQRFVEVVADTLRRTILHEESMVSTIGRKRNSEALSSSTPPHTATASHSIEISHSANVVATGQSVDVPFEPLGRD